MDALDSTSLDGSSAAALGSDPGSSTDATSPADQASWGQAMADAGLGGGGGTDSWGNPISGAPDATAPAPVSASSPDSTASQAAAQQAQATSPSADEAARQRASTLFQQMLGQAGDPGTLAAEQQALAGGAPLQDVRQLVAQSGTATTAINGFYQSLLGQDADPTALADVQKALAAGQSLAEVTTGLRPVLAHSDAATATISAFYQQSFQRAATSGEVGTVEGALAAGQSLLSIESALNPTGTSSNPTLATANDLYQRLFGRNALPQEVDGFMDAAGRGVSAQDYAASLRPVFAKSEAETGTINAFYQQSFQRAATPGELGNIEGALAAGQSLLSIETALDPDGVPNNPTLGAIDDLYQGLFGRNARPQEVDSFVNAMAGGQSVQASVAALRPTFAKSAAEGDTINGFYQAVAGRPANPDELGNIEGALAAGQSLDDIEITLGPPLQVAARAQQQARADATDATYRQVLGRGASATELLDREHEFASGQTMQGVRDGLAHSGEAAADIDRLYQDLFGHGVDAASLSVIQSQIASGASLGEYRSNFAKTSAGAQASITDAFTTALHRPPSGEELDYWRGRLGEGGSLGDVRTALAQGHAIDYLAYHPGLSPGLFPAPIPYNPVVDPKEGYAPPSQPVTLLGADGSVLASNAARDVLAVLPVYVTLNGGQSPSLRLQDGSTLAFGNAVDLAGYLNRTAQRTAPNDPLLGTAYGQTSAWLQQVDQPVLETAIRYAQLARDGDPSQAGLHQAASGLALQILKQDPAQRHALSTKLQQAGHETVVTVGVDGTATFHDKDSGPLGILEAVGTVVVDFLAAFPPTSEVGVPLAVALHSAEAGQAFSNGNVLGGVLSLGTAASFGASSAIIGIATQVAGGVSGIVQGAQRGDAASIVGGVLAVAGGAAAGLGIGKAGFSVGEGPSAVVIDVQHVLGAAGALTSFGAQAAQGHVTDGLVNSLGPWLASLAAESYAKGNTPSPAANDASSDRPALNQFADLRGGVPTGPGSNGIPPSFGNTVVEYAKGFVTGVGIGLADVAEGLFYFGKAGVKFLVDAAGVSAAAEGGFALDDPNARQLNAAAQQRLAQDINQAGHAIQGIGTAVGSAIGDPVGTATDLYNRYKAAEAEAAANGTLPEFYGRFTGRVAVEGGATVLTALDVARGLGLVIKAGDLSSLGAFDVTTLTPVAATERGTLSAAKFGNDGRAILVTDAADRALAQQVITSGDLSGQTSEALVSSVGRKEGLVELPDAKYGGNNGFDHVFRNKDGSITILMETKQLPDGSARLNPSAAGGMMQMSDAWVLNVLNNLDKTSAAFKAITAARDNGTLFKGVIGVDRATGNLNMVRIK